MKISLDLRFARLPCGGRTYTTELTRHLLQIPSDDQWHFYHNPWCTSQQEIITQIQADHLDRVTDGQITFTEIQKPSLTLAHHLSFRGQGRKTDLYHYLHFDMPCSMKAPAQVITIHDLYPLTIPRYCSQLKKLYFYLVTRRNARHVDRVIGVSTRTRSDIIMHLDIPEEKITVIPHGYSERFHRIKDPDVLGLIRECYDLPERFVLYTGTHKPHKNLPRFLRAYARLNEPIRKFFPLYLTGPETDDTRFLRTLIDDLRIDRNVHFLGMVPSENMPALYNLASLYVLPSLYEGFGFGPLEAMACGTPVACSNAGALPEVVGHAGWLFDPYSVEGMSDVLHHALENDVGDPRVRQDCLQQARKFSWDKTARMTYEVYRQAVNGSA